MMKMTICFFNANNLFLRYKMGRKYPGDISGKSYYADEKWGFVPPYQSGSFEVFRPEQTALSADALSSGGLPDILCVCEIENLMALRQFNEKFLSNHYSNALLVDSRDFRQIDVGILSTMEILSAKSHIDDKDSQGDYIFSRDCLEVEVGLNKSGSKRLTLFINHLKSKFVETQGKTQQQITAETNRANQRRKAQSAAVKKIVNSRFSGSAFKKERFIILGDFNDQPDSPWVQPLVKDAGLDNVIGSLPSEQQWTYWWKSKNRVSQIDYLLLSPALTKDVNQHNILPRIERGGVGIKGFLQDGSISPSTTRIFRTDDDPNPLKIAFNFNRFPAVVDNQYFASDHCPIFLEVPY